jgi:preprotein translocase subunit SecD
MNRYSLWQYIIIVIALLFGVLYTTPNFFGESPALQISSGKATVKIEPNSVAVVEKALQDNNIKAQSVYFDTVGTQGTVRVRFADTDTQFKAKSALEKSLNTDQENPTYLVAFNLLPNTPQWLQSIRAAPMYLGLDLRGGVHFLFQVNTKALLNKKIQGLYAGVRTNLHDKSARYANMARNGDAIEIQFRDQEALNKGKEAIASTMSELALQEVNQNGNLTLVATLKPGVLKQTLEDGITQNMSSLSNRVNELGVAEPLIQRQGTDRIIVELPGVQDPVRARIILGRTATLEVRMLDDTVIQGTELVAAVSPNSELFTVGSGAPVVVNKDPVITGDYISSASATIDQQDQRPVVSIDLNGDGGSRMRRATTGKIGKRMAIILFEKGKGEVLTAPTIQAVLGSRFIITGMGTPEKANDLALLLRAGSLAAPMEIIAERTIGPQLGPDNIRKGFNSTVYGFAAIAVFMIIYYMLFGAFSVTALAVNLLLLVAVLSSLQATLTLPGMAAIAFTLGMAIDANVLINERIREELRAGNSPHAAIATGFDRAWATILDSNVTTLIAGLALYAFGSGPIRGFAVVHVLGILTSIFSAVFVSRGIANLWYGNKKKLTGLSIGQIWKPGT